MTPTYLLRRIPKYYTDVEKLYFAGKTLEEIKEILFARKLSGIGDPRRRKNCCTSIKRAIKVFRLTQCA